MTLIDINDIKRTYDLLDHKEETEIRCIEANKDKPKVFSNYAGDFKSFKEICKQYSGSKFNVYAGIQERKKNGTKDQDVTTVGIFPIDIDPVRQKNTSSTNHQLKKAEKVANKVVEYIESIGNSKPSLNMSGNGYQLWCRLRPIKINDNNRAEITKKLHAFQTEIQKKFKTKEVNIDSIHNLSRVMKVIGTISVKGQEHRLSKWIHYDNRTDSKLTDYILNKKVEDTKEQSVEDIKPIEDKELKKIIDSDPKIKGLLLKNGYTKFKSRSEAEQSLVNRLVARGVLDFDDINKIMQGSMTVKWQESSEQYRKITYKKALAEYKKKQSENETGEPPQECLEILQDKNIFARITTKEMDKKIVQENKTRQTIFLCCCGMFVKNHQVASYNLMVNSESGAGKDWVTSKTLKIFPNEKVIKRTRISEKVLNYWHNSKFEPDWTWNGKIFYNEDISNSVLNADVFKVMCSSESSVTVLINQVPVDIEIVGKPVMIVTTATANPKKELLRRFSIVNLDETVDQTKAILERQAEFEERGLTINYDPNIRKALGFLKRVKVKIPFAKKLVDIFPTKNIIVRTHFQRFMDYIKASVALHQYQREINEEEYYIATPQDYDLARIALIHTTSNKFMIPLTRDEKEILKIIQDLPETRDDGDKAWYSVTDLEPKITFVSDRHLRRILDKLTTFGFLEKNKESRENSKKDVMVFAIVKHSKILIPKWEEINQFLSNVSDMSSKSIKSIVSNKGTNDTIDTIDKHFNGQEPTKNDKILQFLDQNPRSSFEEIKKGTGFEDEELELLLPKLSSNGEILQIHAGKYVLLK